MAHRLRPVEVDFVETAPVRFMFARDVTAAPDAVFRALAEDVSIRFEESVLVAKAPEVYTYRVDVTDTPGARAWIEEWRLAPAGTGTRVRMTFALDGTAAFRLVCRLARPRVGRAVRDAVTALDRRLGG